MCTLKDHAPVQAECARQKHLRGGELATEAICAAEDVICCGRCRVFLPGHR